MVMPLLTEAELCEFPWIGRDTVLIFKSDRDDPNSSMKKANKCLNNEKEYHEPLKEPFDPDSLDSKQSGKYVNRLLLTATEVGELLGIGKSTLWRWHSEGRIPLPVHVGGRTKWKASEIHEWVEAGCPARDRWEAIKKR